VAVQGSDTLMAEAIADVPTRPTAHLTPGDRLFRFTATVAASVSLVIVVGTLVFLVREARPAFAKNGIVHFFTTSQWSPGQGKFGVEGLLIGTLIIAVISMVIAVPLGVGMAMFINEYAPARLKKPLTSIVDLLAALPSLLFGMWGVAALQGHLVPVESFLNTHGSALPFLRVDQGSGQFVKSSFITGVVVAIMIMPIITSVTRDVMAQVPREQCEGALALGGTRWGMVRSVILPFSASGIVGASLLGFGRALGETIAVALIIAPQISANSHVLQTGGGSIASWIAVHFGEASQIEKSGLIAAGLALFLMTFVVNLIARFIVGRTSVETA
jgi:phosphate transport system permease protein